MDLPKTCPGRPDQRVLACRVTHEDSQVNRRILFSSGTGEPRLNVARDERGSMARDYRRPAAATRALVATYGDHHVLAVSRRASAHPERVDHQIGMSAPVEPWPRAHHANHAADQHPDVDRLYAGTDRP